MRSPVVFGSVLWLASLGGLTAADEALVGHWRFDTAGPVVPDLSGRHHPARVVGGRVVREGGRDVLAVDGRQQVTVPSTADFDVARGFTIEARLRIDQVDGGHTLAFRNNQFSLRIDTAAEGGKVSFFVYGDGQWEPRVSAIVPEPGRWYHIVATWDGHGAGLWFDGEPFLASRPGSPPPPGDGPLVIASDGGHGAGIRGAIDYVKVYRRAVSTAEIIRAAYGIQPEGRERGLATPVFEFARAAGPLGWTGEPGTAVSVREGALVVAPRSGRGLALQKNLAADVDHRDHISLRMAQAKGSRGEVVFVTTKGAGRIPFETIADGRPHAYVLEPWTWPGWGGRLLALGLVPSEVAGAGARVDYLRVTAEPAAEPELHVDRVYCEAPLPRAGRIETIVAHVRNTAGPAPALLATLSVPEGVTLVSPSSRPVAQLGYLDEQELTWTVRADRPVAGAFRVTLGAGSAEQRITFAPVPASSKADYVPPPVPLKTGDYELWAHYCPLWKDGTHIGWKAIEPWPERKPVLGWYNEGEPAVADWHIKMMLEHGISGAVYCWYRTNRNAPVTQSLGHAIHDGLLKARYLPMFKFAIMWENGCGQGCGSADDLMTNLLPFWIENYFSNPSYLRVDGKPVLYIWVPSNVTRDLGDSATVRKTFDRMRAVCRERGLGGLYLVGCVGGQDRGALQQMALEGWDASGSYGNSWNQPAVVRTVGDFIAAPAEGFAPQQEALWTFKKSLHLLPDIPSAMMGWDSRPWKETPFFWSDNTPETFRDLCLRAKRVLDSGAASPSEKRRMTFCCWNEFGEGHYIEPTRGYGYAYLDVIRDVFGEGPKAHVDLAPEDVGLGPYDSWYRKSRTGPSGPVRDPSWSGPALATWTGFMGVRDLRVEDGILRFTTTNSDPALGSPVLKVRLSRFSKLMVEMRVSHPGLAQVFWTTSTQPATAEIASAHASVPADGRFHRVTFDPARNETWGGCLTGLRFDPTSTAGATIEIRSIRLE